jgi:hypothetical protein
LQNYILLYINNFRVQTADRYQAFPQFSVLLTSAWLQLGDLGVVSKYCYRLKRTALTFVRETLGQEARQLAVSDRWLIQSS